MRAPSEPTPSARQAVSMLLSILASHSLASHPDLSIAIAPPL
jgi:hypothetical protein